MSINRNESSTALHLVFPQIVVVQAFQIFAQFLAGRPVRQFAASFEVFKTVSSTKIGQSTLSRMEQVL